MSAAAPLPAGPARTSGPGRTRHPEPEGQRLTHLRWGVRVVLALGVAASITANVLHARPNPISQAIAAWPPLALLLTVELISRVPANRRGLAAARLIAAAVIAGIAAWVSYWHMVGVAARYGEAAAAAYLLPISVDGLVVVASVSLVEIAGRVRRTDHPRQQFTPRDPPEASGDEQPNPNRAEAPVRAAVSRQGRRARPPGGQAAARHGGPGGTGPGSHGADQAHGVRPTPPPTRHDDDHEHPPVDHSGGHHRDADADGAGGAALPAGTAAAVAYWYRRDPSLHPADIAVRIGRSERTVRRYWPPTRRRAAPGHPDEHLLPSTPSTVQR